MDVVELEIFKHLFASIAEEMGERLMRSAYSPNIKERRDFSCALFDARGEMIAQAAHIPVHLGSTPLSVQAVLKAFPPERMRADSRFILNDPYAGGTHLPDITVVAPVLLEGESTPRFFVANRAHHADVGGKTPGSMPLSTHIDEEGIRIPPSELTDALLETILSAVRTPEERRGDLQAQLAALYTGITRLKELCHRYGADHVSNQAQALQGYTERMMRHILKHIPDGTYPFTDYLDDDGVGTTRIPIHCVLTIEGDQAVVDFRDTAPQVRGPVNAVRAITLSAVNYVFRCLGPEGMPSNSGVMRPITVHTKPGTLVDALPPAPVAAGNVETSQRIVDVLFGTLARALPEVIPAASCGSMNNVALGGTDPRTQEAFTYYETIAGGAGAGPGWHGGSAVHTHMTNTRNTPVEALEHAYPMMVTAYRIRERSGGEGVFRGGDGIVRSYHFLVPVEVTLLTERRLLAPWGLQGGQDAARGVNRLIRHEGTEEHLPPKCMVRLAAGDQLVIETPGGGGWGTPEEA